MAPVRGFTRSPAVPDNAPFKKPVAPSLWKPSFGLVTNPFKADQPEFSADPTPYSIPEITPTGRF